MLGKIKEEYLEGKDFIDDEKIWKQLNNSKNPNPSEIRRILKKSEKKIRLEPEEVAKLLQVEDEELLQDMFKLARKIKEDVYGKRIVFFAPLYIGNKCENNCLYCGFRKDNKSIVRKTLTMDELRKEVEIIEKAGHKRSILVYGEHSDYDADFMVETIKTVYDVKKDKGEIRRVNINAAPLEIEGYKKLHDAGIGTFQIFQETYHHETYAKLHPKGDRKSNYKWRIYGLDRAMKAGIDDVGIGALFGLYDWKFEVMGLLYHTIHLEETFGGVGPHTISFPRIESALDTPFTQNPKYKVSDENFKKIVAIIRLAVPYTGMILTARERPEVRKEVIPLGVSQVDAGSRIGVGGYKEFEKGYVPEKEQFQLGDMRSLDETIRDVCIEGCIPSFCTAGYRTARTGKKFMGLCKPGLVHNYCMPNAILTFKEYLLDYASPETKTAGEESIKKHLEDLEPDRKKLVEEKLKSIEQGKRDIYV
ncbi:[FeFe] hydrogenase H-cluster radical SAM maturase HydG [Clostridium aestuarii]|uniref:[FeFe] hydrogenase H-cluster radical SAM maturase HydG n=1 Tax=Clostridium aestuarii TaxID=338193 RepID=A0ABT4D4D8_9CLOT|nr:[FeFe] hydrogenase H-cluster radical SAM maturase HydG [Clostridium aestuarii]MCY6485105.1 [FeFe] hydrogenase H-cluster radical SAM maturase HydG [Clostridium aestuarii]